MGVALRITPKLEQGFADLEAFRARLIAVALPRALNTLRDQAEVAGLRAVNDEYQIPSAIMRQYVTDQAASEGTLEASITVKGKGFPLIAFKPVPGPQGVTVTIKGRRVLVPHSFIATMPSGHAGVFARGAYGGKSGKFKATGQSFGRFEYSSLRLAINELFTFSPPTAFANERVTQAMNDRVEAQAPDVLRREIGAVVRGF